MNEEFRNTVFRVADIISPTRLVLTCGRKQGVEFGDLFVVYTYGEMQTDPETGEELEAVYLPRGRGKVVVLQKKICTIESTMKDATAITFYLSGSGSSPPKPFDRPNVGDLAKFTSE